MRFPSFYAFIPPFQFLPGPIISNLQLKFLILISLLSPPTGRKRHEWCKWCSHAFSLLVVVGKDKEVRDRVVVRPRDNGLREGGGGKGGGRDGGEGGVVVCGGGGCVEWKGEREEDNNAFKQKRKLRRDDDR